MRIVNEFLHIPIVFAHVTLPPETDGEVGVTLSGGLSGTSTSQTVSRRCKVGHVSEVALVERARGILIVYEEFHVGT